MRDILPEQSAAWRWMESQLSSVCARFGYAEIRTPILEQSELFARSIGTETDIVAKEMYSFSDRDGSQLTLRPEGTASAVRAYIENHVERSEPVSRWYYMGPMFRHERPQKGRYRQFHQVGAELLGAEGPAADVELIDLMVELAASLGLSGCSLELNSLGCPACRPAYRESLVAYLRTREDSLCEDCQRRLATNPLRVLDCKQEGCARVADGAPHTLDGLCAACRDHFDAVRAGLEALSIAHRVNHRMVRGLDYYTRTTFELLSGELGAQNAVAAGGRYDGLVEALGGPEVPAVGFAAGLDRIMLMLSGSRLPAGPDLVFVATRGQAAWEASLGMVQGLRRRGLCVTSDVRLGSLKSQMKRADKAGARFVLLIGDEELEAGTVTVKDMTAATDSAAKQRSVPLDELAELLAGEVRSR
ncbi:MAG: histidine--tRNA ligase [Deltaproteobacteria bacterium]|nr:histidine--tRNA ligase [Deltaproteobacteria bacterium]